MLQTTAIYDDYWVPDANRLITEDDTPVDNFASEKQQRLLVSSLYSSRKGQIFIAAANVGVYYTANQPAIVPDVFLSLDVQVPQKSIQSNTNYLLIHHRDTEDTESFLIRKECEVN